MLIYPIIPVYNVLDFNLVCQTTISWVYGQSSAYFCCSIVDCEAITIPKTKLLWLMIRRTEIVIAHSHDVSVGDYDVRHAAAHQ